jgi:spore coat protein CotH
MRRITIFVLALFLVTGVAAAGRAQNIDVFEQDGVRDVHLSINGRDLAQLRATASENTYYPADFEYRGVKVRNVGIRSRGLGSRNATKLGLRVDFNRYTTGLQFEGHKALVLDNLWQDATLVREKIAMALYERIGVPAPREVFARVFINGSYEGLYTITEELDSQFLTRIGNDDGVLFEYKYVGVWHGEDLGTDSEVYVPLFEARTHERQAQQTLYAPLRDLFTASADLTGDAWRQRVEALVDLHQLLAYLAVETFTSDNDGLLGEWGMNNFYLHRGADGTQHQIVPWDKDQAFGDVEAGIFLRAEENVLVRQALAFPDLRAFYFDKLQQCAEIAAADGWLATQVDGAAALVDAAAVQDIRKQFDEATRAETLAALRAFAVDRPSRILSQVEGARASQ